MIPFFTEEQLSVILSTWEGAKVVEDNGTTKAADRAFAWLDDLLNPWLLQYSHKTATQLLRELEKDGYA